MVQPNGNNNTRTISPPVSPSDILKPETERRCAYAGGIWRRGGERRGATADFCEIDEHR